jgi:FolB domain-containing protein
MSDFIEIEDLLVRAIVGVNPEERVNRQDVLITIRLEADLRPAARSDSIDDAVNYKTITKGVIAFVEQSSFQLVETLAEEIAQFCLKEPRVQRVRVHVRKPGALRFVRMVGVCIERGRT